MTPCFETWTAFWTEILFSMTHFVTEMSLGLFEMTDMPFILQWLQSPFILFIAPIIVLIHFYHCWLSMSKLPRPKSNLKSAGRSKIGVSIQLWSSLENISWFIWYALLPKILHVNIDWIHRVVGIFKFIREPLSQGTYRNGWEKVKIDYFVEF